MRIYANTLRQRPEITIEHNGEELSFSGSVFQRKSLEQDFDVFDPINRYWIRLTPSEQAAVWEIYKDIYRGFDQILSAEDMHKHLNGKIKELIVYHPLQNIETWVSMDPSFVVPPDVMELFIADDENKNTPDKTYLRKDYIQLVAFSVFTRALMPIFGEYIESTRKETGVDFKEFDAMNLLFGTGILEAPAIVKLKKYINQITKEKHRNPERILRGNSSLDMDYVLLSLVVIRKLCVSDVRGTEPKSNLVSRVYNFLYQKVFNPSKTDMPVRDKNFGDGKDSSDQNKRSFLESYRKRTEISLGEKAGFEYGYEDLYGTAERLAPGISRAEVDRCLESAAILKQERLGDAQLIMMSWVFKTVHSPRSVYYISKEHAWTNLAVLEAVLWHWGFHYLSVLSTSHQLLSQDMMHISPIDNRGQIPQELQQKIHQHYPFVWSTLRKNTQQGVTEAHPVLHAIDLVVDDLIGNAWRSTAHEDKIVKVFGEMRRKMIIKPNIKSELANLVIHVAELDEARPIKAKAIYAI